MINLRLKINNKKTIVCYFSYSARPLMNLLTSIASPMPYVH